MPLFGDSEYQSLLGQGQMIYGAEVLSSLTSVCLWWVLDEGFAHVIALGLV